ncbi:MAG TPA: adenylosuccinate lyase [Geminicoccaceae bacterium]|nr:adenylosuccinate lyase [Geminicoccaceae bacterium]
MIPRYSRPEMSRIFSAENRLGIWLEVELAVAEEMAALGLVPADAVRTLVERARALRGRLIDPARVEAIEAVTRHDVIAFLTHVEEVCGAEARFLHLGLTSSDLLDTTLAIQLRQASALLVEGLDGVLAALRRRAFEQKDTVLMGRSHGIHAEPTTMGLKLASVHAAFARARERLARAAEEVATCAVSGAVGTFANIDPRVEEAVARRFSLVPEPVSTQVIPRDRHAAFMAALALLASSIEHLATEIRHLQRTEVGEVEEFFAAGQKGSSAMPHKRNPVLSENLTGLARLIRAAVVPALENVALWHERDISHSAVERVAIPDACILADFALHRLAELVDRLVIHPEAMRRNLGLTQGLHASQRVLLALTEAGLPRQEAYAIVQRNAMQAFTERRPFLEVLRRDPEVTDRLDAAVLEALFDLGYHTKHVDLIFRRVFGADAPLQPEGDSSA